MNNNKEILKEIQKFIGQAEDPGEGSNKWIESLIIEAMPWVKNEKDIDSRYAWCAIFAWKILSNLNLYKGKPIVRARDFLKLGANLKDPEIGALVVLWRGSRNGAKGHVGWVTGIKPGYIRIVGGNQMNKVGENWFSQERVLEYRTFDDLF